jgi:hypothetical protein
MVEPTNVKPSGFNSLLIASDSLVRGELPASCVYYHLKGYHKAIADYDPALELEPILSKARANRAELCQLMKG